MFRACTHDDVKKTIVELFYKPSSHLRIVVAMIAFGTGLNYPNVRRIIHRDPSESSSRKQEGPAGMVRMLRPSCIKIQQIFDVFSFLN